jgi:hypothetical protein
MFSPRRTIAPAWHALAISRTPHFTGDEAVGSRLKAGLEGEKAVDER